MHDQIVDAIYDHLCKKFEQLNTGLDLEQQTELDAVLSDLAKLLAHSDTFTVEVNEKGRIIIGDKSC